MKTGTALGIPSKISLLKDLAEDTLEGASCWRTRYAEKLELSKSRRSTAVIKQLIKLLLCYLFRNPRVKGKVTELSADYKEQWASPRVPWFWSGI
jgi:hypothetical protein